jgi:hypothetical protein
LQARNNEYDAARVWRARQIVASLEETEQQCSAQSRPTSGRLTTQWYEA